MKPRHKKENDTAKQFLEQLAAERGAVITDEEYVSWRSWQLQSLTKPSRIEWPVAGPWLICILIGVGLLIVALMTWATAPADTTMIRLLNGIVLTGLGSYFFFGNLQSCRAEGKRPCAERKTEIDDLLQSGLITAEEHDRIRQAIEHESFVKSR